MKMNEDLFCVGVLAIEALNYNANLCLVYFSLILIKWF